MENNRIDINNYTKDSSFYNTVELVLVIKSFNLQEIRARYIASRKNKTGKIGSVSRRQPAMGGVVRVTLTNGKIESSDILTKLIEPRGIAASENKICIAAENVIYTLDNGQLFTLKNEWFSYIHTVDFSPFKKDHILIASSGFDCIFEYNYKTGEKTYEWFAWENGFNMGLDAVSKQPIAITRNSQQAAQYEQQGTEYLLINDPSSQVLPTASRAAFINSVSYHSADANQIVATFFHEGKVFSIDRTTGKATERVDGLKNPHGGRNMGENYMATSTGMGEVIIKDEQRNIYDFTKLPDKPDELDGLEWLQNSLPIDDSTIITIDSNRNCLVLFNTKEEKIDQISYDLNWAVQDLVQCSFKEGWLPALKKISEED